MLGSIFRLLRPLAFTNRFMAREYERFFWRRGEKRFSKSPVLVYQMGKVGSSTVAATLRKNVRDRRVFHPHFLDPATVAHFEQRRRQHFGGERYDLLKRIWSYEYLLEAMQGRRADNPWKIVTLIRDPVARNLSTFFTNIAVVEPPRSGVWKLKSLEYEFETEVHQDDLDPLIELFYDRCRHDTPLVYFDREFKALFNIDVYSQPFDANAGYQVYLAKGVELLLIRLEDLNRVGKPALEKFLNVSGLELEHANVGSQKAYSSLYDQFKDTIRLPSDYLDRMYGSRLATHFYTDAEIAHYRKRWEPTVMQQSVSA